MDAHRDRIVNHHSEKSVAHPMGGGELQNSGTWLVATHISFVFTPNLGEDSHFDEHIFQMGGSTTN